MYTYLQGPPSQTDIFDLAPALTYIHIKGLIFTSTQNQKYQFLLLDLVLGSPLEVENILSVFCLQAKFFLIGALSSLLNARYIQGLTTLFNVSK